MLKLAGDIPERRKATKSDACAWMEVSIPSLNAWIRRGCPVLQRGNQGSPWVFDLKDVHEWYLRQKWLGGAHDDGEETDPEKLSPKDRLDWYRGNTEKRKDETEAETLVPANRFNAELAAVVNTVSAAIGSLPDTLGRDAGLDAVAVERARQILDRVRASLAERIGSAGVSDHAA